MSVYSDQAHFGDYNPADFGWAGRDPEQNSGLLGEFVYNGASFGSMHVDVHALFKCVLDELVPLIGGTPNPLPGECGCYNPNSVTVGGSRSFHTYGIAIDVNWTQNPMYASAHPVGDHTLPLATSGIATKYGCEWGGDWTYPQDWMHIECHLTPDEARGVVALTGLRPDSLEEDLMAQFAVLLSNGKALSVADILLKSKRTYVSAADRYAHQAVLKAAGVTIINAVSGAGAISALQVNNIPEAS